MAKNGYLNNLSHTGNSAYIWKDYESSNPTRNFLEKQAVKKNWLPQMELPLLNLLV